MDIWVAAITAGAGYLAKYWPNSFPNESKDLTESFSGNLIHEDSDSESWRNFLHQITLKQRNEDGSVDTSFSETSTSGRDNLYMQEFGYGIEDKNEIFGTCNDLLGIKQNGSLDSFKRRRNLKIGSSGYSLKPLNSLGSCLAAQLYKEHSCVEEYVYSSNLSPCTMAGSPLLVTDGIRIISRSSIDFSGTMQNKSGLLERPGKSKHDIRRARRSNSSTTRLSGGPFHSLGTPNGMLSFFLGIALGMMSIIIAYKRKVDEINNLLKQTESRVRHLHEKIEMKDLFTVMEIQKERIDNVEELNIVNGTPNAFSAGQDFDNCKNYNCAQPTDGKTDISEAMRKIEAELEAELERLELNMTSSSEKIHDYVELDPDYIVDVVQGDLKLDKINRYHENLSDSNEDATGTSNDHIHTANYAVSPRELSLRLHEVIESRLEARIMGLETTLANSQKKVHSMELERRITRGDSYCELESSSTEESPSYMEGRRQDRATFRINSSDEALAAYNEAYDEIGMTGTYEEALTDMRTKYSAKY